MNDNIELIARLRSTTFSSDPRTFIQAADALEAAQAENREVKRLRDAWKKEATELLAERDSALARIAELSKQEPIMWGVKHDGHKPSPHAHWEKRDAERMAEMSHPGAYAVPLYLAAGASPQPAQQDFLDQRGEIVDVLCDEEFGTAHERPQAAQSAVPVAFMTQDKKMLIFANKFDSTLPVNADAIPLIASPTHVPETDFGDIAQPAQPSQALGTCEWTLDDDESATWASSCGELWSFIDGGPKENRVTYCHHCGKLAAINAKGAAS